MGIPFSHIQKVYQTKKHGCKHLWFISSLPIPKINIFNLLFMLPIIDIYFLFVHPSSGGFLTMTLCLGQPVTNCLQVIGFPLSWLRRAAWTPWSGMPWRTPAQRLTNTWLKLWWDNLCLWIKISPMTQTLKRSKMEMIYMVFNPIPLMLVMIWHPLAFSLSLRHGFCSESADLKENRVKD